MNKITKARGRPHGINAHKNTRSNIIHWSCEFPWHTRVFGSLIFVGLELRQPQRIALADMEQRRSFLTAK